MITKKEADKLMLIKGDTKGSELRTLSNYIQEKEEKGQLAIIEEKMEELGYPLRFDEIKTMEWYPESLNVLAMIIARDLFGWKNLFEFGNASPDFSFGTKLFFKFSSPKKVFDKMSKSWRKFMDVGMLEPVAYNKKEKYMTLRLKDYMFHPAMCDYFAGFFLRIGQYVIKSKKINIKETKCMFKGNPYHEYVIRWE